MPKPYFRRCVASVLAASLLAALAACTPDAPTPPAAKAPLPAPAPPAVPAGDPATATVERASPPMLQPVTLGKFLPGNPAAEAATGAIDIQDNVISGDNGAKFTTERVALVTGDDHYSSDARYADTMMIEPRQTVELRRVIEETPPSERPGSAFCGTGRTGYFAIASVREGDGEVVKVLALTGASLPAASATDVRLCASTHYLAKAKK